MSGTGIKYIPSITFSYYDHMLDTTTMLGDVPSRYNWTGGEIGFDTYFSMARGNSTLPSMEMTKWFDTNYHFIVPELGPEVKFSYDSHKVVNMYNESKAGEILCIFTRVIFDMFYQLPIVVLQLEEAKSAKKNCFEIREESQKATFRSYVGMNRACNAVKDLAIDGLIAVLITKIGDAPPVA